MRKNMMVFLRNFRLGSFITFPGDPDLVLYFNTESPNPFYADFFAVLLTAVNGKQQVRDQASEYLEH